MKKIILIFLLFTFVCKSQNFNYKRIPLYTLVIEVTQKQEDSIKLTLNSKTQNNMFFNKDLNKLRVWDGKTFKDEILIQEILPPPVYIKPKKRVTAVK